MKIVVCFAVLALFCSIANADEISHRAAAEELLLLTNADTVMKPIWEQMETMMEQQFGRMDAPEDSRPILARFTKKMFRILEEEFSWAKMKDDYIAIYVKTYTEKELEAISEFYRSSAGKKFVEKMPQLMQESMAISQKKMPIIMEKMQKISEEMADEIKKLKEQKEDVDGSFGDTL